MRSSRPCRVCQHIEVRTINIALALSSPAWVARRTKNLTRRQLKTHLERCLQGDAFAHRTRERGWDDVLEAIAEVELEGAAPDPPGGR